MLTFPVPLFGAFVLAFLAIRAFFGTDRQSGLIVFLALCATQSLILALAQHYGFSQALLIQPLTAVLIPSVAWLAFVASARRSLTWRTDSWHSLGAALTLVCINVMPAMLDVIVPVLFAAYGSAIVIHAADKGDALPRVRLESGQVPHRVWRIIGYVLIASALSDVLIVALQIAGFTSWQPLIISVFSSVSLILLGVLSLSDALIATSDDVLHDSDVIKVASPLVADGQSAEIADRELVEKLDRFLRETQLFLDPDLNLARLARKFSTPGKQLSTAINRVTGENVSRNINRYRIEHACTLMREGSNVTTALHASGFNTKSNFNREFNRVIQMTPSNWVSENYPMQALSISVENPSPS